MAIKVGDKIPAVTINHMTDKGPAPITTDEIFKGKKVLLFALPGAFTPTCSAKHVPGYLANHDALKSKGFDTIACLSVNDAFVMDAWGKSSSAGGKVRMLADGNGELTRALGLGMDASGFGMGQRSQRYAMILGDGKVEALMVEPGPGLNASSAESVLARL